MQSMARKEGYSNWNSPLAHQAAGAQVQQQNTYNIYGGNAQEVGGSRSPAATQRQGVAGNQTGQADGYSFYAVSAAEPADRADCPQRGYF
jgi:hypothetical protein